MDIQHTNPAWVPAVGDWVKHKITGSIGKVEDVYNDSVLSVKLSMDGCVSWRVSEVEPSPLHDFAKLRALSAAEAARTLDKIFVERSGLWVELTEHPTSVSYNIDKMRYTLWDEHVYLGTVYFDKMGERAWNWIRAELVKGWNRYYNPNAHSESWVLPGSKQEAHIAEFSYRIIS